MKTIKGTKNGKGTATVTATPVIETAPAPKAKKVRQPASARVAAALAAPKRRLERLKKAVGGWKPRAHETEGAARDIEILRTYEHLDAALVSIQGALDQLDELSMTQYDPREAKHEARRAARLARRMSNPSTPKIARRPVTVGAILSLVKDRETFEGVIAEADFDTLTVDSIRGRFAAVSTSGGSKLLVPVNALG